MQKETITIDDIEMFIRNARTRIQNIAAMKRYGLLTYPPEEETESFSTEGCLGIFTVKENTHAENTAK